MTDYREILRLYSQGISQRSIAVSCGCSRNTVSTVLDRASQHTLEWDQVGELTNSDLFQRLYPEKQQELSSRSIPDCEHIHRELARSGVTLTLLWHEYCEKCRLNKEIPLKYTQFCNYYRKFAATTKATMHISRKPGEQLEVDWAGQTAHTVDRDTGKKVTAYVFVAALSSSQYAYVEAFPSQDLECWIIAHVHAFRFFGGTTRILVPDNLKTGVTKTTWYTPEINRTYHEMAEHYGTAVIPARVRKPKDKPSAEGTVGVISTWILAALRHEKFFTMHELNEAIFEKLEIFNSKDFQKKPGSRLSTFLAEENPLLQPLPASSYELATWKIATVQFNYHISVDKMYYSVPYEYIRHQVDVRTTRNIIEVFYHNHRICSHPRIYGIPGQYSTTVEHMPDDHKQYTQWNAERFIHWADNVGPHTKAVVQAILASHKIEQQGYRACMALLKMADRYSLTRLEDACAKALSYTPNPSYKNISTILKSGFDKVNVEKSDTQPTKPKDADTYSFTRGAGYYGRVKQ